MTHDPLRDADIAPITDGTVAVVLAAGDVARSVCERPAWIRGIEHRIEAHALGVRDLATSTSTKRCGGRGRRDDGAIDVAELHAQFSHEELILARGARPERQRRAINPSGGPLASNPVMSAGLDPHRRGRAADHRRAKPVAASRTRRAGPCLQQNLRLRPGGE